MCFHKDFHDWELESVNSFLDLICSQVPGAEGGDILQWHLNWSGLMFVLSIRPLEVLSLLHSPGRVYGMLKPQRGCPLF